MEEFAVGSVILISSPFSKMNQDVAEVWVLKIVSLQSLLFILT